MKLGNKWRAKMLWSPREVFSKLVNMVEKIAYLRVSVGTMT